MSIPTTGQRGVRFRSRLEARWAAFFHLLGWPWQYEPDLGFEGWIPDFLIPRGLGLMIEVKPVRTMDGFAEHFARIEQSTATGVVWIVGVAPFYSPDKEEPLMGMIGQTEAGSGLWRWKPATPRLIAKATESDWFVLTKEAAVKDLQRKWVKASNALQWRRK